jgi:DNA-binding GntR family transcriptional regulator
VLERHALQAALPLDAPATGQVTDQVAGLRAALEGMREASGVGDRLELANAHRRFHVEVVALAHNRQLSLVYDSVLIKLQLYMAINLRREAELAQPEDGVHRHERLFEAVTSQDSATVLAELAAHGAQSYL